MLKSKDERREKESNNLLKQINGITLVALVITIIVLLILAGVSLIAIMKDNGLIIKVEQAKQDTYSAQEEENRVLDSYAAEIAGTRNQVASSGNPTGTVISYITGNEAPEGYLKCDGTVYNISEYPQLANTIKNGFGKYDYYGGDGTITFAVPDLRGEFLRGTGTATRATGTGSAVGTHQEPTYIPNTIWGYNNTLFISKTNIASSNTEGIYIKNFDKGDQLNNKRAQINSSTTYEYKEGSNYTNVTTRPTNTSVLYCIKY